MIRFDNHPEPLVFCNNNSRIAFVCQSRWVYSTVVKDAKNYQFALLLVRKTALPMVERWEDIDHPLATNVWKLAQIQFVGRGVLSLPTSEPLPLEQNRKGHKRDEKILQSVAMDAWNLAEILGRSRKVHKSLGRDVAKPQSVVTETEIPPFVETDVETPESETGEQIHQLAGIGNTLQLETDEKNRLLVENPFGTPQLFLSRSRFVVQTGFDWILLLSLSEAVVDLRKLLWVAPCHDRGTGRR